MEKHTKIIFILITMIAIFLVECANQLPPDGGEVDTIPPEIIEVYPADGTVNFSDDYLNQIYYLLYQPLVLKTLHHLEQA